MFRFGSNYQKLINPLKNYLRNPSFNASIYSHSHYFNSTDSSDLKSSVFMEDNTNVSFSSSLLSTTSQSFNNSEHNTSDILLKTDTSLTDNVSVVPQESSIHSSISSFISNSTGPPEHLLRPEDFFLSKFLPIHPTQFLIDWMSDAAPYWVVILALPWLTKVLITMPIIIYSQKSHERLMPIIPQAFKEFSLARLKLNINDRSSAKLVSRELAEIKRKYGFNPQTVNITKPLTAAFVQLPVHLTFYISTRTMYANYPSFANGGISWFKDLSLPDHTYALPLCTGITMILSCIYSAFRLKASQSQQTNLDKASPFYIPPSTMVVIGSIMGVILVPAAGMWSAGFNLYMISNMFSYLVQSYLLSNDTFRYKVGLKPLSYSSQFYRELTNITRTAHIQQKTLVQSSFKNIGDKDTEGKSIEIEGKTIEERGIEDKGIEIEGREIEEKGIEEKDKGKKDINEEVIEEEEDTREKYMRESIQEKEEQKKNLNK